MDFSLSDEERMVVETTRSFVQRELAPLLLDVQAANVSNRQYPDKGLRKELQAKARALGLWGLNTPTQYGGAGFGAFLTTLIGIETARSLVPFEYGGQLLPSLLACNEEQQKRYLVPTVEGEKTVAMALSEPAAGSDATRLRTTAVKRGDRWILNGTKTWISRASEADYAIVFAMTDKEKRHKGGITAFLVDRDMGWTSTPIHMMAFPHYGDEIPAEIALNDVEVPEENVLGDVGGGFALAMATVGNTRVRLAASTIGQAQRLLEMAIEHAKARVAFGHPIAEYQAIQWMLADSAVELEAAKWLALHSAWLLDKGQQARYEVSIAKLYCTQMIWRVVDRVMQIHGAMGYAKEMPIERIMRQVRVYRIFDGSDEIQKRSIASALLQGQVDLALWT